MVKIRTIQSIKRKAIYHNAQLGSGVAIPTGCRIRALANNSTITPLELDINHGIQEDPSEQNVELYLSVVDVDNLPDAAGLRTGSQWQTGVNYETVGAATGIFQTHNSEQIEFYNPKTWASPVDGGPRQRYLALIANDIPGNTPGYKIAAQITFLETNLQRSFPGKDDYNEDFYSDVCNVVDE